MPVKIGRIATAMASVVALLVVGCGGGDKPEAATTTTAAPTSTTVDPEPVIRQYASAVAKAIPAIESATAGGCAPVYVCAVDGAVAWQDMADRFEELSTADEVPDEIGSLVVDVIAQRPPVLTAVRELQECSEPADNPATECRAESVGLQLALDDVLEDLAAWGPYL